MGDVTRNMKPAGIELWRDISLAVALKVALLVLLYVTLFSPSHRVPADTASRLFNASPFNAGSGEAPGKR